MRFAKYFGYLNSTVLAHYIFGNVIAILNDHTFGELYKWRNLHDGFKEAKISRKPIFLLIYKSGCPTCERLKPKFSNCIRILDLSQNFVMMNVKKDEIPVQDEARFQPDGTYVPRILFFTPDGEFMADIYNRHAKANEEYKYFYSSTAHIIDSMALALERCCEKSPTFRDKAKGK